MPSLKQGVRRLASAAFFLALVSSSLPPLHAAAPFDCALCPADFKAGRCGEDIRICKLDFINHPDPANPAECAGGCSFAVCRDPAVTGPAIEPIVEADGSLTARLTMYVEALWNGVAGDSSSGSRYYFPDGTLNMTWYKLDHVPDVCESAPKLVRCNWRSSDRAKCYVEMTNLSCNGAPYDFGTYSFRAETCGGPGTCDFTPGCGHWVDRAPIEFIVTKAALGCPNPPKQNCGAGDASSCQVCTPAGVGPGFGLPGYGGPGSWATGPGATLRYSAKGAGHPGYSGTPSRNVALGRYWSHDYAERIVAVGSPNPEDHAWIITKYGTFREWTDLDPGTGVYATVSPSDEYRTLTWTGSGWTLTDLDGTVEEFDAAGLWRSTTDRNLNQKIATYTAGQLTSVALPDGRREDFTYYPAGDPAEGKLASITEYGTDGVTHLPAWDYRWAGDDLTEIDRPDGTALLFEYDGTTGYMSKVTLRADDGTSTRVLRAWSYTPDGKVSETWKGGDTPAAGTEDWKLSYDSSTQTTVTDPLGKPIVYTYELDPASPNVRVTQISGDCPVCGLAPNVQLGYSDPGNPFLPTSTTDGRGITTAMSYDTHGQVTSRTEAMGEPEARTTEWAYDPAFPALATSMDQPSVAGGASLRTTDWTRDGSGNPTDRTISGSEAGSAFTLTTASSFNAAGLPLTIDPPGYTTTDQTSFTYDPSRGDLVPLTRTDPLVGTTTFGYDAFNRRTSVTDPNGLETTTAYDELDRVTEVRQLGPATPTDDLVTAYEYTSFGDLFRTTLPAGNVIEYAYDPAGRLTSIERRPDATTHGERVVYTLDAAGNRTREERQRWDAGSSTWVPVSATAYDYQNRCQVDQVRQAPNTPEEATTAFEYDCDGNLTSVWDPDHDRATDPPTTSYAYDSLNRLTSVTQAWTPAGGTPGTAVTTYSYDVQDHLTGVTDAEGNPTTYVDSDRDLLTQEDSLVSGTTTHEYNEHGEEDRSTDARGIVVARTIDELDRVTNVDYPDDTLDTTYLYDTAPGSCASPSAPVGRLASITRNGETLDFCHDHFGRMVKDGELGYTWDANGNRTTIVYPGEVGDVTATYGFDYADREDSLSVTTPAGGVTPTGVVTAAAYLPSGPLSSLALGNGITETRAFDGRYVPTGITLSGLAGGVPGRTWTYTTDPVGNVTEIVETPACAGAGSTVVLENQTVTTAKTFTSCADLQAGNGFAVESPGHVTFQAQGKVVLTSGFSVGNGASFAAGSGSPPTFSDRTFGYQAPQYFLTSAALTRAAGSWGTRDWSYDKIGNRLSESRDGGASADGYVYTTNAASGDTPVLDLVNLAVTGTRDYAWDAAGNLDSVAPGGNLVDFTFDDASRLTAADHPASGASAAFLYDGRGFLRSATQTAGGTASVTPLYDAAGLLHALRRKPSPTDPVDTTYVFYLAGRPVAQLQIDGTGTETWTYLTTDHLGTPLMATDQTGAITWEGGFEPFGTDYQAGTGNGASDKDIPLRLPGQWDDDVWADATSGAGIYQNAWRWYAPTIGRYTRPDPLAPGGTGVPRFFLQLHRPSNEFGEVSRGQGRIQRWEPTAPDFSLFDRTLPDTLNPYPYALDNPLFLVDLRGLVCGSGSNDAVVPDRIPGVFDFTQSCQYHDNCYCQCGVNKAICDQTFLMDMKDECSKHPWYVRGLCWNFAHLYYSFVRGVGRKYFEGGQEQSGTCIVKKRTGPGQISLEFPPGPNSIFNP